MGFQEYYQAGLGLASAPSTGMFNAFKLKEAQQGMDIQGLQLQSLKQQAGLQAQIPEVMKDVDYSDPKSLQEAASKFAQSGDIKSAQEVAGIAEKTATQQHAIFKDSLELLKPDSGAPSEVKLSAYNTMAAMHNKSSHGDPWPIKTTWSSSDDASMKKVKDILEDPKFNNPEGGKLKLKALEEVLLDGDMSTQTRQKIEKVLEIEKSTLTEKQDADEVLIKKDLTDTLGHPPTAGQILDEKDRRLAKRTQTNVNIKNAEQNKDSFSSWEPDVKEMAFQRRLLGKEEAPNFGWGQAAAQSRKQFEHEYDKWLLKKGTTAESAVSTAQDMKALGKAETNNEQFINRTNTFVNQIGQNVKIFNDLRKKYGVNFGRLVNSANNLLARGLTGSGDLESLRLVLFSTSAEITKLETNQLGIATIPVEQQKTINKIHDLNLNEKDIEKVMNTGLILGKARQTSLTMEKTRLKEARLNVAKPSSEMHEMPPASEHKDKIIKDTESGKRYKSDGTKWVEVK